jgi:hypothetical protein
MTIGHLRRTLALCRRNPIASEARQIEYANNSLAVRPRVAERQTWTREKRLPEANMRDFFHVAASGNIEKNGGGKPHDLLASGGIEL